MIYKKTALRFLVKSYEFRQIDKYKLQKNCQVLSQCKEIIHSLNDGSNFDDLKRILFEGVGRLGIDRCAVSLLKSNRFDDWHYYSNLNSRTISFIPKSMILPIIYYGQVIGIFVGDNHINKRSITHFEERMISMILEVFARKLTTIKGSVHAQ